MDALLRSVECAICFNTFESPKNLQCSHTFCEACVVDAAKPPPNLQVVCAVCNNPTPLKGSDAHQGAASLPTNFQLQTVIDTLKAADLIVMRKQSRKEALPEIEKLFFDTYSVDADTFSANILPVLLKGGVKTEDDLSSLAGETDGHNILEALAEHIPPGKRALYRNFILSATPKKAEDKAKVPREYEDPLTDELMADPVLVEEDGRTYERSSIEKWFEACRKAAAAEPEAAGAEDCCGGGARRSGLTVPGTNQPCSGRLIQNR